MLEMTEFEWPNELRQELSYLIDTNPRDPEVFRRGPEEATKYNLYTLRLLLLTGSNFSDFAILFTFRVLILAILDFNHKTH